MLHTEFTKSLSTNRNFRLIHKICSKWREVFWQNAIFLYHLTYTDFWKVCLYIDFFWKRKICLILLNTDFPGCLSPYLIFLLRSANSVKYGNSSICFIYHLTYWLSEMFFPISIFFIAEAQNLSNTEILLNVLYLTYWLSGMFVSISNFFIVEAQNLSNTEILLNMFYISLDLLTFRDVCPDIDFFYCGSAKSVKYGNSSKYVYVSLD